jgi:ribosomal protein S18 acetylase RimI-like enzyme
MTTIRRYRDEDRSHLRELACQSYRAMQPGAAAVKPDSPEVETYFKHLVDTDSSATGCLFVAETSEGLIGLVCLQGPIPDPVTDAGARPYAFMSDLFVAAPFRRRGIGRRLVRQAEDHASALGVGRLALRVDSGNAAARTFYTGAQYREDFVVMSKALGQP